VGPYPGVNKPNKLSDAELKTGKKYSYPGLHNIRNNFEKKQKQLGTKTVNQ
jgi:hypothetical protein